MYMEGKPYWPEPALTQRHSGTFIFFRLIARAGAERFRRAKEKVASAERKGHGAWPALT
jgi:hypothetical protein